MEKKKIALKEIQEIYRANDVCMYELLASMPAENLSMEEAFLLYIEAKKWADSDKFYCEKENKIEEL